MYFIQGASTIYKFQFKPQSTLQIPNDVLGSDDQTQYVKRSQPATGLNQSTTMAFQAFNLEVRP